ncbi:HET-domain-containing protein [Nemania sp. FL0031]|nr:HET-domain-containing protein [Nemania sp. FL0031]
MDNEIKHLLSINHMCEWCDLLCDELLFYYRHATKAKQPPGNQRFRVAVQFQRHSERPLLLKLSIENSWAPSWHVYTSPEDHAARYITERGVLDKVDSPASYLLASQRIRECESQHIRCPRPVSATPPTRVIDCTDPTCPRLFITKGASIQYAALSYVWGEEQPHRTTQSRFSSYTKRINTAYIPKTIRDAIKVAHTLNIKYLWVDAFCIIQDSRDDKTKEIALIRTIFRNAYITIIAANASKVSDGFLHRSFLYNTPSTLPFNCPDGARGKMYLQSYSGAPREPVNTRAWCLEERVLSTRALWYCSHTLQYECQTAHVNIDGSQNMADPMDGVPRLPDCVFTPELSALTNQEAEKTVEAAWRNMLGLYTRRALTKPRDRLLALSGVAEYFHRFWHISKYIAGLWEHQMPGCLLWYQSREPAPRPNQYRAPSWSWAAVDGEISSAAVTYAGAVCTVLDCNAEPKSGLNLYGEVTTGVLVVNVILKQMTWAPAQGELFETGGILANGADDSHPEHGEIGYTAIDAAEEVTTLSRLEVTAAMLAETERTLLGILLVPVTSAGTRDTYRRVGWFTAPFCDKSAWLGSPHEVINIV